MIYVNGMEQETPKGSVRDYLKQHNYREEMVAVERNEEILPRRQFADVYFTEGDRIEIIHFVGGG